MSADKSEPRPWLAAARERCNLSQEGLAHRLNVSAKTVGNWELGIYLPRIDVRAELAEALGFTYDELLRRLGVAVAPEPAGLNGHGPTPFKAITGWLTMFERAERTSNAILTFEVTTFPALTQIYDYAREVELSGYRDLTATEIDHFIEMRLDRASVLDSAEYIALIAAPLLDAVKGSYQVMAEQLAHLLDLADRPNITLLIIDTEHLSAAPGPFTLLATAGPAADVATEIGVMGPRSAEGPIAAADHVRLFEHLRSLARSPEASREAIAKAARRFADLAQSATKGTK